MTITNYDRIALIPTRCATCNRLFIFEPYNNFDYWPVGPGSSPLTLHRCKRCVNDKLRQTKN